MQGSIVTSSLHFSLQQTGRKHKNPTGRTDSLQTQHGIRQHSYRQIGMVRGVAQAHQLLLAGLTATGNTAGKLRLLKILEMQFRIIQLSLR